MRRAEQLHEEILAQMDLSKEASDEELLHMITKHPEMFDPQDTGRKIERRVHSAWRKGNSRERAF